MTTPDPTTSAATIAFGRKLFVAIATVIALLGTASLALRTTELEAVRYGVLMCLLVAAWQGQQWAIALIALGCLMGTITSIASGLAIGHPVALTVGVLLAALYGGLFLVFLKSESLNSFLKHQAELAAKRRKEDRDYYNRN